MDIAIRRARLPDVGPILELTRDFGREGVMLPLSIGDTVERIRNFLLARTPDGRLIGCVAVDPAWERLMEIRSLAVARESQRRGVGRRLMLAALDDAREFGAEEVFSLTYVPDFFRRFGFERTDRNALPHKIWLACVKCPKFSDCDETAVIANLAAGRE
ncbi:MAG: N-acetyltransferase [Planctomycetota bacterium]|jgi:amino-acid N-acetyltransferase|nr:N-acetyltransferase [Planctomycetota bacterium]